MESKLSIVNVWGGSQPKIKQTCGHCGKDAYDSIPHEKCKHCSVEYDSVFNVYFSPSESYQPIKMKLTCVGCGKTLSFPDDFSIAAFGVSVLDTNKNEVNIFGRFCGCDSEGRPPKEKEVKKI